MSESVLKALAREGQTLQKRAEWFQKLIESQVRIIENNQRAMDIAMVKLEATNRLIDALRKDYRALESGKERSE